MTLFKFVKIEFMYRFRVFCDFNEKFRAIYQVNISL